MDNFGYVRWEADSASSGRAQRKKKMTASIGFPVTITSPALCSWHFEKPRKTPLPAHSGHPHHATRARTHYTKRAYLHSEWVCASKSQVPAESRASLSCIAAFCTDSPFSIGPSRGRAHTAGCFPARTSPVVFILGLGGERYEGDGAAASSFLWRCLSHPPKVPPPLLLAQHLCTLLCCHWRFSGMFGRF